MADEVGHAVRQVEQRGPVRQRIGGVALQRLFARGGGLGHAGACLVG